MIHNPIPNHPNQEEADPRKNQKMEIEAEIRENKRKRLNQ